MAGGPLPEAAFGDGPSAESAAPAVPEVSPLGEHTSLPEEASATAAGDDLSDEEFLSDPFAHLEGDMQSASVDLRVGETRPPAQVTQPRILSRLDLLIEQLECKCNGAGRAGQYVNRPAERSSLQRGPGGQNAMRAARDGEKDWGNLTPKEREKILQSRNDGFPAGYDEILADYFRRVARAEETAGAAPDAQAADLAPSSSGESSPASTP
jgi:hypothetical protein